MRATGLRGAASRGRRAAGAGRPAVAGTIRTDGATVAATLPLDAVSRGKAASVRVNYAGSSSQDQNTRTCKPWRPEPATATRSTSGGALLVMTTRFATPAQAPLPRPMAITDLRSELMT